MADKFPFVGEKVKLENVCEISSGGTPKRSTREYWDGGDIPWVKISDINKKYVTETEESITKEGLEHSSAKLLEPGTLLFSIFASIGAVGILDIPATTNQAIAGLKIIDSCIERDYLYYWLKSQETVSKNAGRGVAQSNINLTILRNMEVMLPDITTQIWVISQFVAIENQIFLAESLLEKLNQLVKSRFVEMFGDQKDNSLYMPQIKLGKVAFVGSSKRVFKEEIRNDGIPFLRGTEVGAYGLRKQQEPTLFISKEHYKRLIAHSRKPRRGDLLMPSICPDGQIWEVDTDKPFYFKDGRVLWVRPEREFLNSTFLRYALANRFEADFKSIASGTTFAELKIVNLKNLDITLPPLALQQEFANFIAQVDKLIFVAQQQIEKLQTLYDSLAQEYFGD